MRTAILTAVLLSAIPAFAQQSTTAVEAECAEKFKATDLNNDGVITHTEIAKAQQLPRVGLRGYARAHSHHHSSSRAKLQNIRNSNIAKIALLESSTANHQKTRASSVAHAETSHSRPPADLPLAMQPKPRTFSRFGLRSAD